MSILGDALTYIFGFLAVVGILVFVHELGHYAAARWLDIGVDRFSLGFGPRLFSWVSETGTEWRVSAIPLGGYVALHGADRNALDHPGIDRRAAYAPRPVNQKIFVVGAGPAMNFLFAGLILMLLYVLNGVPYLPPVVDQVIPDTAAAAAGIRTGDRFVAINGSEIQSGQEVQRFITVRPGETVEVSLLRREGDAVQALRLPVSIGQIEVKDRYGVSRPIGRLGISFVPEVETIRLNSHQATAFAAREVASVAKDILAVLRQFVTGDRSPGEIGGPIGMADAVSDSRDMGFSGVVVLTAVLSINLGLFNLLPLPALDGGLIALLLLEGVRRRPLKHATQVLVSRIGFAMIVGFIGFAFANDLVRHAVQMFE